MYFYLFPSETVRRNSAYLKFIGNNIFASFHRIIISLICVFVSYVNAIISTERAFQSFSANQSTNKLLIIHVTSEFKMEKSNQNNSITAFGLFGA